MEINKYSISEIENAFGLSINKDKIEKIENTKYLISEIEMTFGLSRIDEDNVFSDESETYRALKIFEEIFGANKDYKCTKIIKRYKDMLFIKKDIEAVCIRNIKIIKKNYTSLPMNEVVQVAWRIVYSILVVVYEKKWGKYDDNEKVWGEYYE